MDIENAIGLGKAITHWLEFQILCKRDWLLSEKFIAQPIGEFIHSFHKDRMETEWDHPNFNNDKSGRPKQVDYTLFNRSGQRKTIIEAKWIGSASQSYGQSVLNDMLRLECVKGNISCYMLVAGRIENFDKFQQLAIQPKQKGGKRVKFFESILSFEDEDEFTAQVETCVDELKKFYLSFAKDYNVELPRSFKTKKVFQNELQNDSKMRVFIWRVSRSQNHKSFDPRKKW